MERELRRKPFILKLLVIALILSLMLDASEYLVMANNDSTVGSQLGAVTSGDAKTASVTSNEAGDLGPNTSGETEETEPGTEGLVAANFGLRGVARATSSVSAGDVKSALEQVDGSGISLTNDITVPKDMVIRIPSGNDVVLNLNGFGIYVEPDRAPAGALFVVESDASFQIKGGGIGAEKTISYDIVDENGNTTTNEKTFFSGSISGSDAVLFDVSGIFTLSGGIISDNTATVVNVQNGGTFNMEDGLITGTTNEPAVQTSGTVNLSSGAISNNGKGAIVADGGKVVVAGDAIISGNSVINAKGAAIYAKGGCSVEINGNAVISGNKAIGDAAANGGGICTEGKNTKIAITGGYIINNTTTRYGGGLYIDTGSTATISGTALISNNTAVEGGGIAVENAEITMTGGTIQNNIAGNLENGNGSGGGIRINGSSSKFVLKGGTIAGNQAGAYAGGIFVNNGAHLEMSGGTVEQNVATTREGGGITLYGGGNTVGDGATGNITGGKIVNNKTLTTDDWGGGGIFCAEDAELHITNLLVTDNEAGGFGGGIAGCSTGRLYLFDNAGSAIYDNTAQGENMSGGRSTKSDDWTYAYYSPVFTQDQDYQDYYGAYISTVYNEMLGGGTANWTGSVDGVKIPSPTPEVLTSTYVMGLTAHPTEEAKAAADNVDQVLVSGNYSNTHGGGILCNGYLIVGTADTEEINLYKSLKVTATKALFSKSTDDSATAVTEDMPAFRFILENVDTGTKYFGTNAKDGHITFNTPITLSEEERKVSKCNLCNGILSTCEHKWTVNYTLSEDLADEPGVEKDDTVYNIKVTFKQGQKTQATVAGVKVSKIYYTITNVVVKNGTNELLNVTDNTNGNGVSYVEHGENKWDELTFGAVNNNGATFTNTVSPISISVEKKWDDEDNKDGNRPESVTVNLLENGKNTQLSATLSEENDWKYEFTNLAKYTDGSEIVYTVQEVPVTGYEPFVTGNMDKGFVITNKPEVIAVSVTKTWEDDSDRDGIRPDSVTVNLFADGTLIDTVTVDETTGWKYDFAALPKYKNGKKVVYSVSEGSITDYATSITETSETDFIIHDVHEPEETRVTVEKFWEDENDRDGIRPDSVTLKLLANGKDTGKSITLDESNDWSGDFGILYKYEDGKEIVYTITALTVDGYKTTMSGDASTGFKVLSVHVPEDPVPKPNDPPKSTESPKTSDNNYVEVAVIVFAASVLLILVSSLTGRRRRY